MSFDKFEAEFQFDYDVIEIRQNSTRPDPGEVSQSSLSAKTQTIVQPRDSVLLHHLMYRWARLLSCPWHQIQCPHIRTL